MFRVDNQSRQAVYEQIIEAVEKYVLTGILMCGDKMPSVRKLSVELNVNPNTVQRAYSELERSGVLAIAPGRGAFVTYEAKAMLKKEKRKEYLKDLENILTELKVSGVGKKLIFEIVESVFEGGNNDD